MKSRFTIEIDTEKVELPTYNMCPHRDPDDPDNYNILLNQKDESESICPSCKKLLEGKRYKNAFHRAVMRGVLRGLEEVVLNIKDDENSTLAIEEQVDEQVSEFYEGDADDNPFYDVKFEIVRLPKAYD